MPWIFFKYMWQRPCSIFTQLSHFLTTTAKVHFPAPCTQRPSYKLFSPTYVSTWDASLAAWGSKNQVFMLCALVFSSTCIHQTLSCLLHALQVSKVACNTVTFCSLLYFSFLSIFVFWFTCNKFALFCCRSLWVLISAWSLNNQDTEQFHQPKKTFPCCPFVINPSQLPIPGIYYLLISSQCL